MKIRARSILPIVTLAVILCPAMVSIAFAQSVRVTRDKATVWRADAPSVPLTVVAAGTVLQVVGTRGVWLQVMLPESVGDPTAVGLILESNVEPVSGQAVARPTPATARPGRSGAAPGAGREPTVIRGFVEAGLHRMTATKSFNAVFGKDQTWLPGVGVQGLSPIGVFFSFEGEWYKLKGQRVFVFGDQVFPLGIEDTVTAIPLTATVGYQIGRSAIARPYIGGGGGIFIFREKSQFAQSGEDVSDKFGSYHVVAGVDLWSRRRLSTAVEAQYTRVRDAIGKSGVSAGFDETDLGGLTVRVKVLIH